MARLLVAFTVGAIFAAVPIPARAQPAAVDYERNVRPILAANCFGCHGPRQAQSGLRLDLRQQDTSNGAQRAADVVGRVAQRGEIGPVDTDHQVCAAKSTPTSSPAGTCGTG